MAKKIICPKCSNPFIWNEQQEIAQCSVCGTSYKMHPRTAGAKSPVLMPARGRGVVDYLTVPNESAIGNQPIIKSYIPSGWNYRCSLCNDRYDLVSNPFVIGLVFQSPDESAEIYYFDETFYKHIDYVPQTFSMQGSLDLRGLGRSASYMRLRSFMNASQYCDVTAESCELRSLTLIEEKKPDEYELRQQRNLEQLFTSKGYLNVASEWAGKTYGGISYNGTKMKIYTQVRVTQMMKLSVVPTMQMIPMPSVFGTRMCPNMVNQQVQDYFWDTQGEYCLVASEKVFDEAYSQLKKIIAALGYLPAMERARQNAMALAAQSVMGMAQANSASFSKQQQIISDTNEYTSNIQHQIFAGNAQTHDNVSNMQSEMLKEVNVYKGTGYTVEASTMYDHVYQNTRDPDIFAAQQGDAFEFGVDFEELKKWH